MQVVAQAVEWPAGVGAATRVALVVALAHGVTDMYGSLVPPLLPRLMSELGLSIALAASLQVVYSVAGALPQPLFGYLVDRFGRRVFAVLGPPIAGVFVVAQLRGPLGSIFGISATMAFVQRTFLTMEPIIVARAGGSETLGALALSVYLGAQSLGMVTGGLLADRVDRRALLAWLCFLALSAHVLALWLGPANALGVAAIACAGFFGLATLPPIVVMAQELMPSSAAVSSGIVMGLAWATGSMGVLATGALADRIGPLAAAMLSMPVIAVALALALRAGQAAAPREEV